MVGAVLLASVVVGVGLALVVPVISKRRGKRRAAEAGVLWTGLANFEATEGGQAPIVAEALAGVGRLYGSMLSGLGNLRPVGGVLFVDPDRIWWQPRIWLGRGKAHPWELLANEVRQVVIEKDPPPAIRGYHARLCTDVGDIRFIVADPDGLRATIESIIG